MQRLAPLLALLEARYLPLPFAVLPQAYAVFLWLWRDSDQSTIALLFAIAGALGYELIYVGAIVWAEEGRNSIWTWATAVSALLFSIAVAIYVHRGEGVLFALFGVSVDAAWLHAGFPLVAFFYSLNMHSKAHQQPARASTLAQTTTESERRQRTEQDIQRVTGILANGGTIDDVQRAYPAATEQWIRYYVKQAEQRLTRRNGHKEASA
jgi:hypothetical protein